MNLRLHQDKLMAGTLEIDGAELLLPISQDSEEGTGYGLCAGYTAYWANSLLNKTGWLWKYQANPVFKQYVANAKMEGLNHLLRHKKTLIPRFQEAEKFLQYQTVISQISAEEKIYFRKVKNAQTFAQELCDQLSRHSDEVFNLRILVGGAHSVGMKKEGNFIHFFDCNFGWFRFQNEATFSEWFQQCYVYAYDEFKAGYGLMLHGRLNSSEVGTIKIVNKNIDDALNQMISEAFCSYLTPRSLGNKIFSIIALPFSIILNYFFIIVDSEINKYSPQSVDETIAPVNKEQSIDQQNKTKDALSETTKVTKRSQDDGCLQDKKLKDRQLPRQRRSASLVKEAYKNYSCFNKQSIPTPALANKAKEPKKEPERGLYPEVYLLRW